MTVELFPHQQTAVDELANGKILWGGVGTGKSLASLAYFVSKVCGGTYADYGSMRTPTDLYVITTAKKRDSLDWHKEAIKFGISSDQEASIGSVKFTVDSWNNIERYIDVREGFFIFDEQRLVGSGAWTKAFIKIAKNNRWILLSATPGDTWLDYIPVFVANGFYPNRTAFKRQHVVYNTYSKFPKVDRYVGTGRLVRLRNSVLVEMPYDFHTVRKATDVLVEYDKDLFERVLTKRWHVYENRPLKDVRELFSVMRKVVNSDASRLVAIQNLLTIHPKLIVFYNFNYELEILRRVNERCMIPTEESQIETHTQSQDGSGTALSMSKLKSKSPMKSTTTSSRENSNTTVLQPITIAEWNGHKHEPIPETDRWVYLVQYVAGSEGWNCIETDAVCFYSLTYSYKNFHQAHGRIDRLNTPFQTLWYYTLLSSSKMDRAIMRSLKAKKNFNVKHSGFIKA